MSATAGTAIVMFTDLVGSTELRVRLGEERADELRRVHDELLSGAIIDAGGEVVKGTGDGVMAVFTSASGAVAAAIAVQRAVVEYSDGEEALAPMQVRVGLSAGDVSREADDYFGTPVIEAARLCDASGAGQILAADLVRVLTRNRGGHRFGPSHPLALKGLPDPVDVCEVWWRDGEPAHPVPAVAGRSAPAPSGSHRVRIFGSFEIEHVDMATLGSRKGRQLARLLALGRGAPVSADRIIEALWGDAPPAKPNDQVSVLVSRLRSALGSDAVVRSDAGYALMMSWLDLSEFDSLAADAEQRLAAGSAAAARVAAGAALQLARGPLLADETDAPWADDERFAVQRRVGRVRVLAAEAELDAGEPAAAAALAEQALDDDPYDEAALRLLMRAHVRAARPASALAAYARVRERLRDDLGVSPSAETEALHDELVLEPTGSTSSDEVMPGGSDAAGPFILTLEHAPLAGRDAALRSLDDELELALAGGVRFVVVEGESGIGKSTLLEVWSAAVVAAGVPVLRGRCDEVSRQLPLQAVLDALDAALVGLDPVDETSLLGADADVLRPLLGRRGEPTAERGGGLAALTGSGSAQAVLFAALVGLTDRLLAARGGVLIIDDLHFAGESTSEWLRFLQRRSHGRLLVVAATRPEGKPVLHPDVTVALGPLDLAAAVELVGDASRAAELLARSGGHPLLLVELAHADEGELPLSIREAAADRLRQMGEAGVTIQTAAVLSEDVDLDLLADVLERSAIDVLDDIEQGVSHRFLDEAGATLVFRHALVREALVSGMSTPRRSLLHREASKALARREDADPLEVARHARLGGELELAAIMLGHAAARATRRHDGAEALRLLDEAIELHDGPELRVQRGLEHLAAAQHDDASADARAARELGGGARALELLGWSQYYLREFDAAAIAADEGSRLATDPAVEASCLVLAGRVLLASGDLRGADERMTQAESLADVAQVPVVPIWIGALRVQQGRPVEAIELADRGLLQPGAIEHPYAVTHAHLTKAHALAQLGRPDEALRVLDVFDSEVTARHATDRFAGRSNNWRGWILRYLGAFDEAAERNVESYEAAVRLGGLDEPMAHSLLDQADGALLTGALDAASSLLSDAAPYDDRQHVMRWRHALRRQLLTARLHLAAGEWDATAERAAAVVADADGLGVERYVVLGTVVGLLARSGTGDVLTAADVEQPMARLDVVAGTEAWWWQAQLARATGIPELRTRAETTVSTILGRAGPHRETLERFASSQLQ